MYVHTTISKGMPRPQRLHYCKAYPVANDLLLSGKQAAIVTNTYKHGKHNHTYIHTYMQTHILKSPDLTHSFIHAIHLHHLIDDLRHPPITRHRGTTNHWINPLVCMYVCMYVWCMYVCTYVLRSTTYRRSSAAPVVTFPKLICSEALPARAMHTWPHTHTSNISELTSMYVCTVCMYVCMSS